MEKLFKSFKRDKVEGKFDAIIIGSGLGGLSTAAYLSKHGKKILILERHYEPGGFTHVFKRRGYEWDVGVHYVGDVHRPYTQVSKMFNYVSDGNLKWAEMGEVYDVAFFGDKKYEFRAGTEAFINQMQSYFPNPKDQEAIERYVELVYLCQKSQRSYFMEKPMPNILSKLVGNRLRKKGLSFNRSTYDVLSDLTDNPELIGVLTTQFGDYGLPPKQSSFIMHAMVAKHYMNGGCYPIGGSSMIFKTIAPVINKSGGEVFVNAEVTKIILDKNNKKALGVEMANGQEIMAPLIISNAGVINTYEHFIDKEVNSKYQFSNKLQKVTPSVGHVCLYVGFDHSTESLQLKKPNYWIFTDSYDHDANIQKFLDDPKEELPLTYVSFPSAKDPDWENRYPGKASIDIIGLADWKWVEKWKDERWKKRGEEYETFKEEMSQRLLEKLFRYEPQLRGKVDFAELSTPLSTKHFVNYQKGELYGLDHDPQRFEQKFLRPKTPIKNLYLTGQDIITCGIGAVLASGAITATAILKKNMFNLEYKNS